MLDSNVSLVDWAVILDMEVRFEVNLTFSAADIVAICIWEACGQVATTEKDILGWRDQMVYEENS